MTSARTVPAATPASRSFVAAACARPFVSAKKAASAWSIGLSAPDKHAPLGGDVADE